jgi:small-conductance mechanosensitive channel
MSWPVLFQSLGILAVAIVVGLLVKSFLFFVFSRVLVKKGSRVNIASLAKCCSGPVNLLIPIIFMRLALPLLSISQELSGFLKNGLSFLTIGTTSWLFLRLADLVESVVLSFYKIDVTDNLEARKIHTQIRYLKKVIVVIVLVIAAGSMLMMFEKVRQFGTGILASAGIAGIVIGLAAQRSISNLLVGIQIAITQPIRIDDVLIVENEWGWVEEITSTYAVLRLWDLRRLIVPLTYFTEKPFQNWTRVSANIIGSVFIYVDYSTPVDVIRAELLRILKNSDLWDGKTWVLQVTNTTEQTMELRALMSAKTAPLAWDLRCEVREKLINFLQTNYPASLPKIRAEINQDNKENK